MNVDDAERYQYAELRYWRAKALAYARLSEVEFRLQVVIAGCALLTLGGLLGWGIHRGLRS